MAQLPQNWRKCYDVEGGETDDAGQPRGGAPLKSSDFLPALQRHFCVS